MARVKMVTRTIETTNVKVLICNVLTQTVYDEWFYINGNITDNSAILENVKAQLQSRTLVPVSVLVRETSTALYGMPESEFMKYAQILPDRGSKKED